MQVKSDELLKYIQWSSIKYVYVYTLQYGCHFTDYVCEVDICILLAEETDYVQSRLTSSSYIVSLFYEFGVFVGVEMEVATCTVYERVECASDFYTKTKRLNYMYTNTKSTGSVILKTFKIINANKTK